MITIWLLAGVGQPSAQGLSTDCTVNWTGPDGMTFLAETGSDHLVTMDGVPDGDSYNFAPRPVEMTLLGAGDCTACDVVLILKRGHQGVQGCGVKLHADRAETDPKVFTRVHFTFAMAGYSLERETVECAMQLSHEKYCSALVMLTKTAEITHSLELVNLTTQPMASE